MYECQDYLVQNGYKYEVVSPEENYKAGGFPERVEIFTKHFDGYTIVVSSHENEWGGKEIIELFVDPPSTSKGASKPWRRMAAPSISFFATGYHDYATFEKKAKQMVKQLKRWAIEVI
jgi:hypothetical protein